MSADAQHDYHLVNPSPWPVLGALSAFLLFFGLVLFMHPSTLGLALEPAINTMGIFMIAPGVIMLLATTFMWWRDVVAEAQGGDHKPVVQLGMRYGMVLFILSEVMFFAAFFWAYFDASLFPADTLGRIENISGVWPPANIHTFDPFGVPFLNTLILLLSGISVTWAHHALIENNRKDFQNALGITVLLGIFFSGFQAYEYVHADFSITDGIYGSTFYLATGFHGFHVIIGTIFLAVCWFRGRAGHFTPTHHFGFEAAAWYWHFVDVVWLFLFCGIYWWGA